MPHSKPSQSEVGPYAPITDSSPHALRNEVGGRTEWHEKAVGGDRFSSRAVTRPALWAVTGRQEWIEANRFIMAWGSVSPAQGRSRRRDPGRARAHRLRLDQAPGGASDLTGGVE